MSDVRTLLEQVGERFPFPAGSFKRLEQRRRRKARNQRIGAAAVALLVMAAVIGGTVIALRSQEATPRPASPHVIRPSDVSKLRLIWRGITGRHTSTPVVADGVVYVTTASHQLVVTPQDPNPKVPQADLGNKLFAFPAACRNYCSPVWTAEIPGDGNMPAVSGGVVYVEAGHQLLAFPARCGSGGATCSPLWTGSIGAGVTTWTERGYYERPPLVSGGAVYVAAADALYEFPTACGTGGAECRPLWTVPGAYALAKAGNEILTGVGDGVSGFASSCSASPCNPLWHAPVTRGWGIEIAVSGDDLFVTDVLGLRAFSLSTCRAGRCMLLWKAVIENNNHVEVPSITPADGYVYVRDGHYLYAFPTNCKSDGSICEPYWTSLPVPKAAGTVIRDGVAYGASDIGAWARDAANGAVLWTWDSGTGDSWGMAVANGMVFVSSGDGIYAFGIPAETNTSSSPGP